MNLDGIIPPVTTPFDPQGQIAWEFFKQNLLKYNAYDLAGYVVLGSNGESAYLTMEEKLKLLETAREVIPKGKTFIAGASIESTQGCIDFLKKAAALGVEAALVGVPHYFKSRMTDDVIAEHYLRVADESPVPILLYNVPQFTGVKIAPAVAARLSNNSRIIGIKDSSGDLAYDQEIQQLVSNENFRILIGSASVLMPGFILGMRGAIVAIANAMPNLPIKILKSCASDWQEALALHRRMFSPARMVTTQFGIPGLKYAMDLMGFHGGYPRAPLKPLREEQKLMLQDVFRLAGLLEDRKAQTQHS